MRDDLRIALFAGILLVGIAGGALIAWSRRQPEPVAAPILPPAPVSTQGGFAPVPHATAPAARDTVAAESAPEIYRVGGEVERPEIVVQVAPVYTEAARRARVQGIVVVEAIIRRTGEVAEVHVLKGLPLGLDQAAVEAVKQWRFRPAMRNGRPVDAYYTLTVVFRLQ